MNSAITNWGSASLETHLYGYAQCDEACCPLLLDAYHQINWLWTQSSRTCTFSSTLPSVGRELPSLFFQRPCTSTTKICRPLRRRVPFSSGMIRASSIQLPDYEVSSVFSVPVPGILSIVRTIQTSSSRHDNKIASNNTPAMLETSSVLLQTLTRSRWKPESCWSRTTLDPMITFLSPCVRPFALPVHASAALVCRSLHPIGWCTLADARKVCRWLLLGRRSGSLHTRTSKYSSQIHFVSQLRSQLCVSGLSVFHCQLVTIRRLCKTIINCKHEWMGVTFGWFTYYKSVTQSGSVMRSTGPLSRQILSCSSHLYNFSHSV